MRNNLLFLIPLVCLAAESERRTDIEFAHVGEVSLTLDAGIPQGDGPFPAVIIVHGGGWEAGDKQTYVPPLFQPLADAGFAWFSVDYRLAPEHQFPACTDDVSRAIRWVKKNAPRYKVDTQRIALMGESAGGHIVSYLGAVGRDDTAVAAVVSFYGLHDLLHWEKQRGHVGHHMKQLLGISELNAEAERRLTDASPITFVHPGMPPFLFIHGTADTGVPLDQSQRMCDRMKAAGAACEVFTVEGAPHGIGNWEEEPKWQTYKKKMVGWLHKALRSPAR